MDGSAGREPTDAGSAGPFPGTTTGDESSSRRVRPDRTTRPSKLPESIEVTIASSTREV
jgi:hypothetical protein